MIDNNLIPEKDLENIKRLAWKVHQRSFEGIEYDDLVQEGVLAYISQRKKYDKEKNDYYMGFVFKRVYGAMLDWVEKFAFNGRAAVRRTVKEPDYKIAPAPEHYEQLHNYYNFENDVENDIVLGVLMEIIENNLTKFEQKLLFDYLSDEKSCFQKYKQYFKQKKFMIEFIAKLLEIIKNLYEKGVYFAK